MTELVGHGGVFRSRAGRAAHRQAANFGVHVKLQLLFLELLGHIDVNGSGLGGDCIRRNTEDLIHARHFEYRAAVGRPAACRGMVGTHSSNRAWVLSGVLQDVDDVLGRMRFHHRLRVRYEIPKPVCDCQIGHADASFRP